MPLAAAGNGYAQNLLGVMYSEGQGVTQNAAKAIFWYRKAAEQGIKGAQFNLGGMYEEGLGVPENDVLHPLMVYRCDSGCPDIFEVTLSWVDVRESLRYPIENML